MRNIDSRRFGRSARCSAALLSTAALFGISLYSFSETATAGSTTCISPWQARIGTAADDEIHAAVRDAAGNLYVAGFENGVLGVENDWPIGDVRGVVAKHAVDGSPIWRKVFALPGSITLIEAVAFDSVRNRLAIAGRTSGAFQGSINQGQFDLFVALLDSDSGELLALSQFGDQYPQHPMGLAVMSSGDLVVAGLDDTFVQGNAVLGQPTQFVARYAQRANDPSSFEQKWWKQPNEPGPLSFRSAAFALTRTGSQADDVAVVTRMAASVARGGGVHLTRLDGQGNVAWDQLISPASLDVGFSVASTNSGRLYVAGITVLDLAGPAQGGSDGFLMERDSESGNLVWGQQFGSAGADWVASLAIDETGNLFVAGNTNDVVVPGSTPSQNSAFALTFSASGTPLGRWQAPMPSTSFLDSLTIVPACNGAALIAGNGKGDLPKLNSLGGTDSVILTIQTADPADGMFTSGFE